MILKIFVIVLAVWILLRLIASFREKKIDLFNFIIWSFVWLVIIVIVSHPLWTDKIAKFMGVGRGADIAFFIAIFLLFYLVFRVYVKITAVESDVTEVVKHIALINHKINQYGKKKKN